MVTINELRESEVRGNARQTSPNNLHFNKYFRSGVTRTLFIGMSDIQVAELSAYMIHHDNVKQNVIDILYRVKIESETPLYTQLTESLARIYGNEYTNPEALRASFDLTHEYIEIPSDLVFDDSDVGSLGSISEHIYGEFSDLESEQCLCGYGFCSYHFSFTLQSGDVAPSECIYGEFDHESDCFCEDCCFDDKGKVSSHWNLTQYSIQSLDRLGEIFTSQCIPFEELIDHAEQAYVFMDILSRRKENESMKSIVSFAMFTLFKMRYKGSLCVAAVMKAKNYIEHVFPEDEYSWQSSDVLKEARGLLTAWKNIQKSPIVDKVYKCICYALSFSLFESVGVSMDTLNYTKLEQSLMQKKYHHKADFAYVLCDTLLFIVERGYQVYKTGDINTIFHCGGTYKDIFEKCELLTRQARLITDPESHGFTESEFRASLDQTVEKLQSISKHATMLEKYEKDLVKTKLDEMLMMRDDLTTRQQGRKSRKAPFGVLLYGDSGIGKSFITEMLCVYFATLMGLGLDSSYRYTRNPKAKYWDGYVSSCHTIILDDVACERPSLNDTGSVDEILQIMNNAAFCPDQAALQDKGRTPMRAKLVVATTNRKDLNAYHYFTTPSAVQRRFPFIITPRVKDEFLDTRGMLDSSKVPDTAYPDCWRWSVDLVKPVPIDESRSVQNVAELERLLDNVDGKTFFLWYKNAINDFQSNQRKFAESVQRLQTSRNCVCCQLPENYCLELQSQPKPRVLDIWANDYLYALWLFAAYIFTSLKCVVLCRSRVREWSLFVRKHCTLRTWEFLGNRVAERIGHPKMFMGFALIISAGSLVVWLTKYKKQSGDRVSEQIGTVPMAEINGRENVWYKNEFDVSPASFSRESASSRSVDFSTFLKKLSVNCCSFTVDILGTRMERPGKMFCLGGHVYITNNHNLPTLECGTKIRITETVKTSGINRNYEFVISEKEVIRHPSRDIAFVTLRQKPPKKCFIEYIIGKSYDGKNDGSYIIRREDGGVDYIPVKAMTKIKNIPLPNVGFADIIYGTPEKSTHVGDCGSMLVADTGYGYAIIGMHVALCDNVNRSMALAFDGDFIRSEYAKLEAYTIESGDLDLISAKTSERKLGPLHKKSCFRYLKEGYATIYGSFADFRGKGKSSVVNTPMSYELAKEGYRIKYTKPEMKSWVPWHIAAKDLVQPVNQLDSSILDLCVASYINDVTCNLGHPGAVSNMLMVLDNFTAINGAQVAYIDKINRNTSAGNPWKKSKRYFMESCEPQHGMLDPVKVDDEIMDRVDEIINCYKAGKCAHPNFCAHLKDEPVSFKKSKVGKTRVFTGAPFDWTIVVRKYLLSFTRLVQNERLAFESGPGTIAQSLEWQELYDYIFKHGTDRVIAGDYKAFDKRMSPMEILAAFDVIIHFCKESGNYTDEDIRVIRCVAEDTAFPLVDYNGDLITLHGSNPSGNPLTVILNSLVNCLRMRYVYFLLNPNDDVHTFKENVSLMTYGDDNIMSVREGCDWYNHTTISKKFSELGIEYTMADKEAESVPYIQMEESSFLKRTWRYEKELGCYVAPLDHDSIEKMLMVWNRSKSVSEGAQAIAVIESAMGEYFFYGREIYNDKLELLRKVVEKLGYMSYASDSTFLTFDELVERFKKCSKHCDNYNHFFLGDKYTMQSSDRIVFAQTKEDMCYDTFSMYSVWDYPSSQSMTGFDLSIFEHIYWATYIHIVHGLFTLFLVILHYLYTCVVDQKFDRFIVHLICWITLMRCHEPMFIALVFYRYGVKRLLRYVF
jgi:hypothetical protein